MASVSTYLNFPGNTEDAFRFYQSVFKTDFEGPIARMGEVPPDPSMPTLGEKEKNMVMHVCLPILGGHKLMGTDSLESMGHVTRAGNNVNINLQADTRVETKRLFEALGAGGKVTMPLEDMFWGDYFGSVEDKFGIHWMFNCAEKKA